MYELYNNRAGQAYHLTGLIKEIGRSRSADISLADDRKTSRIHARLEKTGDDWVLVDLDSTNGTYVNGERIEQQKLRPGDEIRVGNTLLFYREAASSGTDEPEEATRVDINASSISSKIRGIFKRRKT